MRTCVSLCALLVLLSGCGEQEFSHRAEFSSLEPYAQVYVNQVLAKYFGEPGNMVVWERLPLKEHLATGSVKAASADALDLDLSEPHQAIGAGAEVLWMGGPLAGQPSAWISSWDEKLHSAQLAPKLANKPEAGTPVIVGPGQVLVRGRMLYAEHCLHCHGITGDGAGPTAQYLNPRPRDYRKGLFKFTVTQASERASRADLSRVIENGIPGTYMPSFKLLTPDEMQSIVEYVLWLSMRGETEYQLVKYLADGYSTQAVAERVAAGKEKKKSGDQAGETSASIRQEFYDNVNNPEEIPGELNNMIDLMITRWTAAQEPTALLTPKQTHTAYDPESIARGRKLYLSADLNCVACHGEAGYGDGPQTYSITKDLETGVENPEPGLFDAWGNKIVPRNLHTGIFRGGRRPLDVYSRVHAGIKGTPMPAFGAKLKDQDIWDVVNYVYSVPFESEKAGAGLTQTPAPAPAKEMAAAK